MGGGTMLRPVTGAVGGSPDSVTILTRPTTTTNTVTNLHSLYPSSSHPHLPLAANCTAYTSTQMEDKRASGSFYNSVFGSVPSRIEVEKAIAVLQKFMRALPASGSEIDWLHQVVYLYDPKTQHSLGYGTLYNAFHLLQTEPSVQRMVVSISSDKVVWEAILNNKEVQDLQESLYTAKVERLQSPNEESDFIMVILRWILDTTKAKVMELIGKFGLLVNELFQPAEKEKPTSELTDLLEEKLRSSWLLSMVIMLIVVVTRSHGV